MENDEEIDMGDEVTKFCVSWVTIRVMDNAIQTFIQSWNHHRIPGPEGGIPNVLASQNNQVTQLHSTLIPSTADIMQIHEQSGNILQRDASYGQDPLNGYPHLQELRERDFVAAFPDFGDIFTNILHHDASMFKTAIHQFIVLTENFATLHPV